MKAATGSGTSSHANPAISIHAAREGGDVLATATIAATGSISIHAAREGGDYCAAPVCYQYGISIHAAREGGDCGNE